MIKNKLWFTLVELLVVVVIVSILSTVWFVSYVDYLRWARDSSRIQQVTGIFNAIQLFSTRSKVPLPRKVTQIRYGSNLIWYQGDIDLSVLERVEYSEWWKDPKTLWFYSYMISSDRKSAQLLTYFEDISSIKSQNATSMIHPTHTNAVFDEDINYADLFDTDYSVLHPFVYWFELWILIDDEFKAPINKNIFLENTTLDLFTSTWSFNSYLSNSEVISGSWDAFVGIIPRTDCAKLQSLLGWIPDGIYKINPSWVKPINTYCDMTHDNGGWTLVWRSHPLSSENFWWLSRYGNVFNNDESYSMGEDIKAIRFNEILFTTYNTSKNITSAVKLTVDDIFFNSNIGIADDTTIWSVTNCSIVLTWWLVNPCDDSSGSGSIMAEWWKFALDDTFWTWYDATFSGSLINNGYIGDVHLWSWLWDSFDGKQGMIFVR